MATPAQTAVHDSLATVEAKLEDAAADALAILQAGLFDSSSSIRIRAAVAILEFWENFRGDQGIREPSQHAGATKIKTNRRQFAKLWPDKDHD